ncbi:NAD(P)/FAD-dependent oxidoreductase [Pseudaestuariivita sp.]|uniref:NAD(P)/FAD-dependent oxidoreductase n=1 Tax=Pseudaestuariivita sp. TaxID=2211669 RepID=UPI0040583451
MAVLSADARPGLPYWWEGAVWPALDAPPPAAVDLLVLGAGYTGLSAAIAAHDAGAKVAVVDAGQPGQGASTRNGGMVGAHPRLSWDRLTELFGEEVAAGVFAEAAPSLAFVQDAIAREGIDCDFAQTGRIQLAWTRADHAGQRKLAETVAAQSGLPCEVIAKADLRREVGTDSYHGALLFPTHGALHPRKYHDGLLAAVLRRGITVTACCRAGLPVAEGGAYRVETPHGTVRAGKVLVATGGYTRAPFRRLARRVFPLPSYLIATEPVSPNLLGELAPGKRMMVETRARHSYFRLSPDGTRVLFGGRASMVDVRPEVAAARLHATMSEVWPELAETQVSHVWSGNTGYSFTHMPHVGSEGGVHWAMGFSGSGTVMAPYLGAKAAWRALGDPRGETAYAETTLRTSWLHPGGRPWFLQAANLWYRMVVDRAQNLAARR